MAPPLAWTPSRAKLAPLTLNSYRLPAMSTRTFAAAALTAAGLTWATIAGMFAVTRVIDARLDLISCRMEAQAARLSAAHCPYRSPLAP